MKKIKIAFLGFGNIGCGVYRILNDMKNEIKTRDGLDIEIAKILVRDLNKARNADIEMSLLTTNASEIIEDPSISIVIESMGGEEPARSYILSSLKSGKKVVTANKEVVSKHWDELRQAAEENNTGLYYEASVAGGIPIIKVLEESLQANRISEMMGIINGTTNFILTKMYEEGRNFDDVLKEAQTAGYAEPDPTSDIEAFDPVFKLSILSSIAFHQRVEIKKIYREGITNIKKDDIDYGNELGYVLKLLAIGKMNGNSLEARVHPTFLSKSHPLASVRDSYNAVFIKGDSVGNLMLYGRGAGDLPTGSAVVSDIINASRSSHGKKPSLIKNTQEQSSITFNNNWESQFFIRLTVKDKPGVLANIAGILGKHNV
ncbi:MAG TPA: homoserine dehydrogenase, partial [Clostridia bacterium]